MVCKDCRYSKETKVYDILICSKTRDELGYCSLVDEDTEMSCFEPKKETIDMKKVPCEVWARCVGYYRPVKAWNEGKKSEFQDRKPFYIENVDTRSVMVFTKFGCSRCEKLVSELDKENAQYMKKDLDVKENIDLLKRIAKEAEVVKAEITKDQLPFIAFVDNGRYELLLNLEQYREACQI